MENVADSVARTNQRKPFKEVTTTPSKAVCNIKRSPYKKTSVAERELAQTAQLLQPKATVQAITQDSHFNKTRRHKQSEGKSAQRTPTPDWDPQLVRRGVIRESSSEKNDIHILVRPQDFKLFRCIINV